MFKVMSFCLHACTQPLSPLTNSFDILLYVSPYISDVLHQVAGVADKCLVHNVQCTHISTSQHKSPYSVVDRVSGSTRLFGGHRSVEIKSDVSC